MILFSNHIPGMLSLPSAAGAGPPRRCNLIPWQHLMVYSHRNRYARWIGPCLPWGRISTYYLRLSMSMSINETKREMFSFLPVNAEQKGVNDELPEKHWYPSGSQSRMHEIIMTSLQSLLLHYCEHSKQVSYHFQLLVTAHLRPNAVNEYVSCRPHHPII